MSQPILLVLGLLALALAALWAFTRWQVRRIRRRLPPLGRFHDVGGYRLHAVHIGAAQGAHLPPIVFLHGASGNLRDPLEVFLKPLAGRAELLFVDRPGHGHSERGPSANARPDGQARAIAELMRRLGIDRAIVVGHSFGASIAAAFAVTFPEMTAGLVFLAPATHPWPGGVSWHYRLARRPLLGRLFTELFVMPAGLRRLERGSACVFAPNRKPDGYVERTGPDLMLRPATFRANAEDICALHGYVSRHAGRYRTIAAPTVIVTGDSDGVVLPDLHARGLYRDIDGSELVWLENVGHKPDYVARDLVVAAIERVAGTPHDLQAMGRALSRRLAGEAAAGRSAGAPGSGA